MDEMDEIFKSGAYVQITFIGGTKKEIRIGHVLFDSNGSPIIIKDRSDIVYNWGTIISIEPALPW